MEVGVSALTRDFSPYPIYFFHSLYSSLLCDELDLDASVFPST